MARFGSYELDSARHQLSRDGHRVHLTPKAFDLLCFLVEAAPRVVRKTELHERLWPRGVVSDATLVGLVKEIRRALDEGDGETPAIRTAHRVGYAFEIPVTVATTHSPATRWLLVGDRRIALFDGVNVIGRDPDSQVVLDYSTVSRRHARLVISGSGTTLEDLSSKNGTTLEGAKITAPSPLRDGARFACGQVQVVYRESLAPLPTATLVRRPDSTSTRR